MRRRFLKSQTSLSYMTIEALEYTIVYPPGKIEYSFNGGNTWEEGQGSLALYLQKGAMVSFRNMEYRAQNSYSFDIRGSCNLVGNCMSLIPDGKLYEFAFSHLFENCDGIISVSEDFLPATTLALACYASMFYGCTNLTTAPELPATILANSCYASMFYGCSKLNYIKMLATDISASDCLFRWVRNVASIGTFIKNPAMTSLPTATSSNDYAGIPNGWTVVNDGEE